MRQEKMIYIGPVIQYKFEMHQSIPLLLKLCLEDPKIVYQNMSPVKFS